MSDSSPRKKARRRPKNSRSYTVTPAVLAQRRSAAVKTGEHAQRPIGQLGIPCKRSRCPLEGKREGGFDTCPIRLLAEEADDAPPEFCPVALLRTPQVSVFQAALDGEVEALKEVQARLFARLAFVTEQGLEAIEREGIVSRVYVEGVGDVYRVHPAATALPAFLRLLGVDAKEWRLTPASQPPGDGGTSDALDYQMLELYEKTEGSRTFELREGGAPRA